MLGGTDNVLHQRQLLEYRPSSWRFCPQERRMKLLFDHGLSVAGGIVRRSLGFPRPDLAERTEFPYVRSGFDTRGDYVLHRQSAFRLDRIPADAPLLAAAPVPVFSPRLRQRLEAFAHLGRQRGARVFFTFPPRPEVHWLAQRAALEPIESVLRAIPGVELLDSPADHVYDLGLFADTPNHLTDEGGRERTLRIIASLKARLRTPFEEVGDRILCGQAEREAADGQASQDAGDLEDETVAFPLACSREGDLAW
jgi:hypothetical protein